MAPIISFLLAGLLYDMFHFSSAKNLTTVYLDPVKFDSSDVCTPQLDKISSLKSNISEALRMAVSPYVDSKDGGHIEYEVCGGPGWTRMVYLNMNDLNTQCPSNWRLNTHVRGCGRSTSTHWSCDSARFSNPGLSYNRMCGRIIAYQERSPYAFYAYNMYGLKSIELAYASGALLTHGPVGSRKHIWTFAGTLYKGTSSSHPAFLCPCTISGSSWPYNIPPFVGNNYFCDASNPTFGERPITPDTADPLWDGAGCPSTNSCCQFNSPPWFYTTLPETTTDGVEIRLCSGDDGGQTIISLIELYVGL